MNGRGSEVHVRERVALKALLLLTYMCIVQCTMYMFVSSLLNWHGGLV